MIYHRYFQHFSGHPLSIRLAFISSFTSLVQINSYIVLKKVHLVQRIQHTELETVLYVPWLLTITAKLQL